MKNTTILLLIIISATLALPDGWCDPLWCNIDPDCVNTGCGGSFAAANDVVLDKKFEQKSISLKHKKNKYFDCVDGEIKTGNKKKRLFEVHNAGDGRVFITVRPSTRSFKYVTVTNNKQVRCDGNTPYFFPKNVLEGKKIVRKGGKLFFKKKGKKVSVSSEMVGFTDEQKDAREPQQIYATYEQKQLYCTEDGFIKTRATNGFLSNSNVFSVFDQTNGNVLKTHFATLHLTYLSFPTQDRIMRCNEQVQDKAAFTRLDKKSKPNSFRGYYANLNADGNLVFNEKEENDRLQFALLDKLYYFQVEGKLVLKPLGKEGAFQCVNGKLSLDNSGQITDKNKFEVLRVGNDIGLKFGTSFVGLDKNGKFTCSQSEVSSFFTIIGQKQDIKTLVLVQNFRYITVVGNNLRVSKTLTDSSYFTAVAPALNRITKTVETAHDEF